MGLRDALRLVDSVRVDSAAHVVPNNIASPPEWGSGLTLDQLIWVDLLGTDTIPVTRAEAMAIPALARGRNILCPTLGRLPLEALRGSEPVDPQPAWLFRTDSLSSPFHRMLWTVDDQLFYGASLWWADRGTDGFPIKAGRIPWDDWDVTPDAEITVHGEPVDARSVIYLPGPHEGILAYGTKAIRGASTLEASALATSQRPFRVELHQTTDEPMNDAEIGQLVAKAKQALSTNDGILFTNAAIKAEVHPYDSSQLTIDGRNANDVNMARLVGLPAALVDANTAGSSLTYETTQGRNQQAVDYGFAAYMAAITSRLSMDDCVPRGTRVAFETADLTALSISPTGPELAD